MKSKLITICAVMAALLLSVCPAGADQFMNITFDGDTIGSAPATGTSGSPITKIGALGGYTATDYFSPPTADCGTIIVDNVAGMSKAAVLTTNSANGEIGALFMDTGLSVVSSKLSVTFDIAVLAAPAAATAQAPYYLNGTSETAGVLFGLRAYASTIGQWAFSFAVAPTSASGGVFALRDSTNTQLTSFGSYVNGQKYRITLSADYSLGTVNAYVDGVLALSGYPLRGGVVADPTPFSELFIYFNGESGYSNQVAIDNIQMFDAAVTTWDVATVHGQNQFTISPDNLSLHYNPQGWTDYAWYENNGSAPGTFATTTAGPHAPLVENRSGMRTFATTDVAVGQKLKDLKLVFDFKTALGYPTINFFMTDGAGKFGIFAPTSLGIGVVGGIVVLDADWSRMTIDLTQPSIPDSTNVAVYEHNGLAADKIYPFTTMQWGDIKDLNIAGVYDYQRSPTKGWSYWGKMFDKINTAGNATVVNGHGLALIWGDTANSNNAYGSAPREIRNVTVSFGGTDYTGTFANAQYTNVLKLDVQDNPVYLKPGEFVVIDMDALALAQDVFGCQAVLNFSSTYFITTQTGLGSPIVAPGGGVWNELIYDIWNTGGDLDVAVGVNLDLGGVGTKADGTVAKFTLTATNNEGTTQMVFRPDINDIEGTFFADADAQAVYPGSKLDSQTIVIDGTSPTSVVITADPVSWTKNSPVVLTFSATDALSGIDHYELSLNGAGYITATSPYNWDVNALATGTYPATVKAIDKAGNEATASTTVYIDKTNPVISITSAKQNSFELIPSGTAVQGVVNIQVTASDVTSGLNGHPTVTVTPNGGSAEAATYVNESPSGTFNYTWTVSSTTANGMATINASVSDNAGNSNNATPQTFNVNKNQITGQVELQSFVGASRAVTFVATGGTKKTWMQTLTFSGSVASYTLTDVPAGTTNLSAKTAWNLRKKVVVTFNSDGQATVNFTGSVKLLGGDINGSNSINILDYSILKVNYFTSNAVADIDGDGVVNLVDYSLMKSNWFMVGDPE